MLAAAVLAFSCATIDAACLARIDTERVVDFSGGGIVTDPVALEIMGRGLDVAPHLLELFADPTATQQPVPLVGGTYAIGDIAGLVADRIVDVPWWSFLPAATRERLKEVGELAFYEHVRESEANRLRVARRAGAWLAEHRHELRWDEQRRIWSVPRDVAKP